MEGGRQEQEKSDNLLEIESEIFNSNNQPISSRFLTLWNCAWCCARALTRRRRSVLLLICRPTAGEDVLVRRHHYPFGVSAEKGKINYLLLRYSCVF